MSAPAVFDDVVNDIHPIEKSVNNRPPDRLPFHVGYDHCKSRAKAHAICYLFGDILGRVMIVYDGCFALEPINKLFDGDTENVGYLVERFYIRLSFAAFPVGYCLSGDVQPFGKPGLTYPFFFSEMSDVFSYHRMILSFFKAWFLTVSSLLVYHVCV